MADGSILRLPSDRKKIVPKTATACRGAAITGMQIRNNATLRKRVNQSWRLLKKSTYCTEGQRRYYPRLVRSVSQSAPTCDYRKPERTVRGSAPSHVGLLTPEPGMNVSVSEIETTLNDDLQ